MPYTLVQAPFDDLRRRSKPELAAYSAWFQEVIPERIAALFALVKSTPGFSR